MSDKNITIQITAGTFFKAVLVLLLFWLLFILQDLVLVLLTSVVLASAIEPATKWFGRYKVPRVPAVLIIYVILITALIGIVYLFIPPLFAEVSRLASTLPEYVRSLDLIQSQAGNITAQGTQLGSNLPQGFSIQEWVKDIQNAVASFSGGALRTVSAIFGGVFSFLLIVVISFYLAVQERGVENFLRIITPTKHERYVLDLWKRSQTKIGKWMQGQLLLGVLIGILVYLGLTVLGVPYAFTLAIFAAMMELIPVFGPVLAAVPAVILGFIDSPTLGLMVIGLFVIIQQFENHLIYPLVVRKVVGVPPLLVILALIIGGKLAGFLGVLLSVPVAAAILEFTNDIQEEKARLSKEEEKKKKA